MLSLGEGEGRGERRGRREKRGGVRGREGGEMTEEERGARERGRGR